MPGIAVRSAGELYAFMAMASGDERLWDLLDLDELHIAVPVSIRGPGGIRDGRLDAYGARFVRDLQNQIYQALRIYGGMPAGGRKNMLRASVSMGSDKLEIDFTAILKEMVRKMSPAQATGAICFGLFLAAGYFGYGRYSDAELDRFRTQEIRRMAESQMEHDERFARVLSESNANILEIAGQITSRVAHEASGQGRDAYRPVRRLVQSMSKRESITVGGGPWIGKEAAVEHLGPLPSSLSMYYVHADGVYSLLGIDLHEGAQGLRIATEDAETTALLGRLDPQLKDEIIAKVEQSMDTRTIVNMPLQIDIFFTARGVHHAVLLGVGHPRRGTRHYTFADVPNGVSEQDRHNPGL